MTLLLVCVLSWLLAPRWIRSKALKTAAARGLVLTVRDVRLGLGTVQLEGLTVAPEGVAGVKVAITTAHAPWTLRGVGKLTLDQVVVDLEGDGSVLREELQRWRERHPSAATGEASASTRSIVLQTVTLNWTGGLASPVTARVREIESVGGRLFVRDAAGRVSVPVSPVDLEVEGLTFEVDRGAGTLVGAAARKVAVRLVASRMHGAAESGPAAVGPSVAVSQTPSAVPVKGPIKQAIATKPSVVPKPSAAAPPKAPLPPTPTPPSPLWARLDAQKARLDALLARMGHGLELKVDELSLELDSGRLGPWIARVVLGTDALTLEMQPAEKDGRKPLELHALVPRGPGKWSAELRAGPASLAEVGIAEGNFGLSGVDKSTVLARGALELDPELKTVAADGTVQVGNVSLQHAGLSDLPLTGIEASIKGVLTSGGDFSAWSLTGGRIELGKGRVDVEGTYERVVDPTGKQVPKLAMAWAIPTSSCGDVLASMPKGLMPRLDGLEMTGTFAAHGRVVFDARALEKTDVDFGLDQRCRVNKAPVGLSMDRFHKPFELRVYDGKGQPKTALFGPGSGNWTPFSQISPYVVDAVLTCEDGAFFSHAGFSAGAIRNALIANLRAGKFMLGASTVSMQTAKNAFLDRKKQLGRKLEEAVLTAWLEQALSKNQILELYLNVIEFGPDLYGIGPASMHWFGRPPSDLDPAEAMFLISLLPSPVKRHGMWGAGAPSEGYLGYVRTLLKEAHRRGKLDDEEYEAASKAPLVFHKPGQPLPPPHGINASKVDPGKADDPAWDPVLAPTD
ncbi:MAG: transglycosylase domain-containing protein [Myxococcales bacterium]|nr:transglycosylase domain-containing protein [Myxococcales bacterium]